MYQSSGSLSLWHFNCKIYRKSPKNTLLKNEMWDFYLLKMLPFALTLIKTKIHHLFDPIKNIYTSKTLNSHEKWAVLTNGSKSWRFFVLINARANGHIFMFNKPHISLRSIFWDTLYNLHLPLNIGCSDWRVVQVTVSFST